MRTTRSSKTGAVFAVLVLFALSISTLHAHSFDPTRHIVFEEAAQELALFIVYSEPPGERTDLLMGLYDTDGNGRLTRDESKRITPELHKRAIAGLKFSRPIDWSTADFRVRHNRRSGLSLAILVPTERRLLTVFLPNARGNVPLDVLVKGDHVEAYLDSIPQVGSYRVNPGYAAIIRPTALPK